jgi:hypothetical protein
MKTYDGAMLHATNKQKVAPGELGDVVSLDLGNIPEDIVKEKIGPIIIQLADILKEYKVYMWLSTGYHEDNTDNEV